MIIINGKGYRELRCGKCKKLFGYEKVYAGRLAVICPKCGELNQIEYTYLKSPEVTTTMDKEFSVSFAPDTPEKMEGGEK